MADRTLKPDSGNDLVLQNDDASAKIEIENTSALRITSGDILPVSTGTGAGHDFSVNNSQLVVEGDTGDVGLGTTDPEELLHLNGTEPVIKLVDSAVSGAGFIDFDGSGLQLNTNRNPNTGTSTNVSKTNASIQLFGLNEDANIRFYTTTTNNSSSTERMRILSDGDVEVKTGSLIVNTSGQGIGFGSTLSQHTLDDFETGSWTPVFGTNSGSGVVYSANAGIYGKFTKIGQQVIAEFSASITVSSASGSMTGIVASSLPFTPKSEDIVAYTYGGYLVNSQSSNEQTIAGNTNNPATAGIFYFQNRVSGSGQALQTGDYGGVLIYRS
tara:strand:- start:1262 stop:2242 length:981 start_codon:yes stop_codon:yes gene_type:complete